MKGKRQMEEAVPGHLVHNMPTYPVISKSQRLCVLVFSPVLDAKHPHFPKPSCREGEARVK